MPTLSLDDVELSYVQQGDGPDIVWIPGGDQRGIHFAEQYEASPDFRNTAYDPRGVGETVSHAGPPWTTTDLARDCAALIREVCNPPVVLTGLSMGSLIVQQVVLDYPELIRVAIPMGTRGGWPQQSARRLDASGNRFPPSRGQDFRPDGGASLRCFHVPLGGIG